MFALNTYPIREFSASQAVLLHANSASVVVLGQLTGETLLDYQINRGSLAVVRGNELVLDHETYVVPHEVIVLTKVAGEVGLALSTLVVIERNASLLSGVPIGVFSTTVVIASVVHII